MTDPFRMVVPMILMMMTNLESVRLCDRRICPMLIDALMKNSDEQSSLAGTP